MRDYILFIDSGIGGLSTLAAAINQNKTNYIYFADNLYAPYGNKSETFLRNRLKIIIENLRKNYNISMVVLACNTATTTSIDFLREKFRNIIFIGTEPATKLAHDNCFLNPAIIATPQTINHLKHKNFQHLSLPCKTLASLIENHFLVDSYYNRFKLAQVLCLINNKTKYCDCVILGCTHYSLINKYVSKITTKPVLDGNRGVANRVCSLCNNFSKLCSVKIILSNKNKVLKQKYKKILNQILANRINLC